MDDNLNLKNRILDAVKSSFRAAKGISFPDDRLFENKQKSNTSFFHLLGAIEAILQVEICIKCGQEITGKFCSCDTEAEMKHRLQQDENEQMLREWEQEQATDNESRFNPYAEYGVSEKDFF